MTGHLRLNSGQRTVNSEQSATCCAFEVVKFCHGLWLSAQNDSSYRHFVDNWKMHSFILRIQQSRQCRDNWVGVKNPYTCIKNTTLRLVIARSVQASGLNPYLSAISSCYRKMRYHRKSILIESRAASCLPVHCRLSAVHWLGGLIAIRTMNSSKIIAGGWSGFIETYRIICR